MLRKKSKRRSAGARDALYRFSAAKCFSFSSRIALKFSVPGAGTSVGDGGGAVDNGPRENVL